MELTFIKNGKKWIAEFEVTSDFNIHIEKPNGEIYLEQRTTPTGEYDSVNQVYFGAYDKTIDIDFTALVYPKYIRLVSEVEPTMAVVTLANA